MTTATLDAATPLKAVVLLHGIKNNRFKMKLLENALKKDGYETINITYPSTKHTIEELIEHIHDQLQQREIHRYSKVDFVGHSMGGVIIRELLKEPETRPVNLGRVVMIGSPHSGSEIADTIKDWKLFQALYGPAGQQLTTDFQKAVSGKIYIDYPLGIIAGTDPVGGYIMKTIAGADDNDGLVSVESTKLNGMDEHITIDKAPHTFLPILPSVIKQVIHFLNHGKFDQALLPKPKNQDPSPK